MKKAIKAMLALGFLFAIAYPVATATHDTGVEMAADPKPPPGG